MIFLCVFVRQIQNSNKNKTNLCLVENGGDFRAIKPLQIAPENAGNRISEAQK